MYIAFRIYTEHTEGGLDIAKDLLVAHNLSATIYPRLTGVWQGKIEQSMVIELLMAEKPGITEFDLSARVHNFANAIKQQLKQGEILLTKVYLEHVSLV